MKKLLLNFEKKTYWLGKAATMQRFEYSPLGKELKAQTDTAKKHYQKLDDTFKLDKMPALKNYSKSNVIHKSKHFS